MDTTRTSVLTDTLPASELSALSIKERLFARILGRLKHGSLLVTFPGGQALRFGEDGTIPERLEIRDAAFFGRILKGGSVGFGEAYVDGLWNTPNLTGVLKVLARNQKELGDANRGISFLTRKLNRLYHLARRNTVEKSRENIREHYDLSNDFYATFLDGTMTYSSARFESYYDSLERAQLNKIDRMLNLAEVGPRDEVLEIGSGWGAMALRAAERGARVKTITLSEEQHAYAAALFKRSAPDRSIEIALEDYRHTEGQYDAVVSCEMIEAVGKEYLQSYFDKIRDVLKPGGRAVIQAITIPDERYEAYSGSCDWIQKHIFPGGHLPSPGAIQSHVEASGDLRVESMEGFGEDYAETLNRWAKAFNRNRKRAEKLGFDARFRRKWNYYLSYCEAGFDAGLIDVKHVVLRRL